MQLEAGQYYHNGHGERRGPMEVRTPDVWLDEYGGIYKPDGTQWNHTPDSAGNLKQGNEADEAYGYLSGLFKLVAPQCDPLPSLMGLCTQIDNYIAGLRQHANQ